MRRSSSGTLPNFTPYRLCEISRKKQPPIPIEVQNTRFTVLRRVTNPKKEPDQRTLPLVAHRKIDVEEEEQKFKIFNFKRQKIEKYSTPRIPLISPQVASSSLLSNGVEQDLMFKPQRLQELLTPTASNDFYERNKYFTLSRTSVLIEAKPKKRFLFKDAARSLFSSVLKPDEHEDDRALVIQEPPIRGAIVASLPVPVLPAVSNYNVFNPEIAKFEREKIINMRSFIHRNVPFIVHVRPCISKNITAVPRNITNMEQLKLSEGEFTLVEYIDDNPIIQPMVGMVTTMTVLALNPELSNHPFDQRLPFVTISPNGPRPFVAKIPDDQPIIAFINQVASSVVAPHELHSETDFILCMSKTCTLHRMPKVVYLSTKIESRVQINFSKNTNLMLDAFLQNPSMDPVELCKYRSILLGIRELANKGIVRRFTVPSSRKTFMMQEITKLPQELRNGIYQYISILKQTPWHRASNVLKARLGIVSGQKSLAVEEGNKAYLSDMLNQSFRNQIFAIQAQGDDEEDILDLDDIPFFEENEEEDWTDTLLFGLEKSEKEPIFRKGPGHTKMKHLIDWKTIFPNMGKHTKMRKVMLTANYEVVDGVAKCSVSYNRDPEVIKQTIQQEKAKKSFLDFYKK
jgi:hypothetical protein